MSVNKPSFNSPKTFIEPVAFMTFAFLAGHTRLVECFCETTTGGGLLLNSGMASIASCMHDWNYDGSRSNFLRKIAMLTFASIVSGSITKVLKGRVSLSFEDNLKILGVNSAVVLIKEVVELEKDIKVSQASNQERLLKEARDRIHALERQLIESKEELAQNQQQSKARIDDLEQENGRISGLERDLEQARRTLSSQGRNPNASAFNPLQK